MSGVSGEGVTEVLRALRREIDTRRDAETPEEVEPWRP